MRREAGDFGDAELELIYVARKLKDALRLEEALTRSGVDYAVEPDKYLGGVIFRTERVGAFFYVEPCAVESSRQILAANGFQAYEGE